MAMIRIGHMKAPPWIMYHIAPDSYQGVGPASVAWASKL